MSEQVSGGQETRTVCTDVEKVISTSSSESSSFGPGGGQNHDQSEKLPESSNSRESESGEPGSRDSREGKRRL